MSFITELHRELFDSSALRKGAHGEDLYLKRYKTHKEYPRMEQVPLPQPAPTGRSLEDALAKRHSAFAGNGAAPFTLGDLGSLFGHALGERSGTEGRKYPSGGALYPIETYLLIEAIEGGAPGVYHYNPVTHALERLWDLPPLIELGDFMNMPEAGFTPSALVVFTSVWSRSSVKYGNFAYLLALLEAGHMSENILLVGTALGLDTHPTMLPFHERHAAQILDLDGEREQVVQAIALAKPQTRTGDATGHG